MLRGPGGADRYFTHNPREGTFKASTVIFGQLTMNNGLFRLTETDGTVCQFRSDLLLDFFQDTNANRIHARYTKRVADKPDAFQRQAIPDRVQCSRAHLPRNDPVGSGTADDRVTIYQYDASGEHLLRVIAPGNRITDYTYDTAISCNEKHALTSVAYADGTHSSLHTTTMAD